MPTQNFSIRPVRRDSIIAKAAEEIRRFIEERALKPGARLPNEVSLAHKLGISRNSLREAMRVLDGLGFVEKRADRDIIVKGPVDLSSNEAIDAQNVERVAVAQAAPVAFQVRAIIEGRCAELAIQVAGDDELDVIGAHLRRFCEALDAGDFVLSSREHLAFHDAIVRAGHNSVLASIYYKVRFVTSEIGQMGAPKLYKNRQHVPDHEKIYEALKQRNSKKLLAATAAHFKAIGSFVEFMSSNQGVSKVRPSPR